MYIIQHIVVTRNSYGVVKVSGSTFNVCTHSKNLIMHQMW